MTIVNVCASVVAGILWGTWPYLQNKSAIPSNIGIAVFNVSSAVVATLLTYWSWEQITAPSWKLSIAAGTIASVAGVIFLRNMPKEVSVMSQYFLVSLVVQSSVPAMVSIYKAGPSPLKIISFVLVGVGIVLMRL